MVAGWKVRKQPIGVKVVGACRKLGYILDQGCAAFVLVACVRRRSTWSSIMCGRWYERGIGGPGSLVGRLRRRCVFCADPAWRCRRRVGYFWCRFGCFWLGCVDRYFDRVRGLVFVQLCRLPLYDVVGKVPDLNECPAT